MSSIVRAGGYLPARAVPVGASSALFLCETTLAGGEPEPPGHLSVAEAQTAFTASGSRRLLVTQRPQELPVADGVELAREGLAIEL
jgi:ribonuclease BN (tRNA processing enzyme)